MRVGIVVLIVAIVAGLGGWYVSSTRVQPLPSDASGVGSPSTGTTGSVVEETDQGSEDAVVAAITDWLDAKLPVVDPQRLARLEAPEQLDGKPCTYAYTGASERVTDRQVRQAVWYFAADGSYVGKKVQTGFWSGSGADQGQTAATDPPPATDTGS